MHVEMQKIEKMEKSNDSERLLSFIYNHKKVKFKLRV